MYFASLWFLAWIAVHTPQMAHGVICKPVVENVDRRVHAFGGIRGSSCTRLLVAYADRRLEAFGVIRGLSFASLWWLTWIAVQKPMVAGGVVHKSFVAAGIAFHKPFVAYVGRRVQGFWRRTWIVV